MTKFYRYCFILLFICLGGKGYCQTIDFGPVINYERTSIHLFNGNISINESTGSVHRGFDATGYESNISLGIYGSIRDDHIVFSTAVFFNKTSSKVFKDDYFSSITVLPYLSYYPYSNCCLLINVGFGFSFITKKPKFITQNEKYKDKMRAFDVNPKISVSYEFYKRCALELGIRFPLIRIIKEEVSRSAGFIGLKIPINNLLRSD